MTIVCSKQPLVNLYRAFFTDKPAVFTESPFRNEAIYQLLLTYGDKHGVQLRNL